MKLLLPLLLALSLTGCGSERTADTPADSGFLILDGAGPLGWDAGAPPPDAGPPPGATRGKFCHALQLQGGQSISITLQFPGAPLTAATGSCSPCRDLPPGTHSITLTAQGQTLGSGSLKVEQGKQYVYWLEYDPGTNQVRLTGGTLDPAKGQTCENYTPKL